MFRAMRSRLWVRLVGVFALASVVPLIGAGWLTSSSLEHQARVDAEERLRSLAETGRALVTGFVDRGQSKLTTVARLLGERSDAVHEPTRTTIVESLNRLVEPADLYLETQFYPLNDPVSGLENGQEVVTQATIELQRVQQSTVDFPSEQSARNVQNLGSPIVTTPLSAGLPVVSKSLNDHYGFPSIQVSVPVVRAERPAGAMVAYLDMRELQKLLEPICHAERRVALVDADGVTMLASGPELPGHPREAVALKPFGWSLCVAEPRARVFAASRSVRSQTWLWTALAALLVLGLSLLCAAWLVRPVHALTRAAQAMEKGDLSARARLTRVDEIGRLGRAFDSMAEALQQLDAAKSSFVGTVSHELRTPLTSMKLALGNVLDGILGDLEPGQQTALARVRSDVERLDRIVQDALVLARLEAGAELAQPRDCDLGAIAEDAARSLEPIAAQRGIRLETVGSARAMADPELVRRVLVSLLDNAVKFSPEQASVRVELAHCGFRVIDCGPGFTVDRPFDAFTQGEQHGNKTPGVGLGLAIVKQLVALQGGRVAIDSSGAAGGIVAVELPEVR